jgi:hypothetical protein
MKFNETPAEARKLWIDELRSGNWKQGKRRLACGDEYCCLGVATELFVKLYPEVLEVKVSFTGTKAYSGETHVLPPIVQEWLGFEHETGKLQNIDIQCYIHNSNTVACSLSMVNDWAQYTFEQIAQLIEDGKVALKEKE